jgi:hypothetical protein
VAGPDIPKPVHATVPRAVGWRDAVFRHPRFWWIAPLERSAWDRSLRYRDCGRCRG